MNIKITNRYPHVPIRIAKMNKLIIPSIDEDVKHMKHLCNAEGNVYLYNHLGNLIGTFSKS